MKMLVVSSRLIQNRSACVYAAQNGARTCLPSRMWFPFVSLLSSSDFFSRPWILHPNFFCWWCILDNQGFVDKRPRRSSCGHCCHLRRASPVLFHAHYYDASSVHSVILSSGADADRLCHWYCPVRTRQARNEQPQYWSQHRYCTRWAWNPFVSS